MHAQVTYHQSDITIPVSRYEIASWIALLFAVWGGRPVSVAQAAAEPVATQGSLL